MENENINKDENDLKKLTFEERFSDVEKLLFLELEDIKKIEDEIKAKINGVSNNSDNRRSGSSPFTYISELYKSLVSMKSGKLTAIKDIANIRKMAAELDIKIDRNDNDEDAFQKVAQKLLDTINAKPIKLNNSKLDNSDNEEKMLEILSEEAFLEEGLIDENEDNENTKLVIDEDTGEIFLIDENYEIVKSNLEEELDRFEIKRSRHGKVISAIDKFSGDILEIVSASDDDNEEEE